MQRLIRTRSAPLLLLALAFVLSPATGLSQDEKKVKPQKVKFDSYDGVDLHGSFYRSKKGNSAPCVLILHAMGENRSKAGWDDLAQKLLEDYTVLSFDFRGHGDSTDVQKNFWSEQKNQQGIKGANPNKQSISYKDFGNNYWPMLVNDVVGAKRYLDKQNDANQCNSSNVLIIADRDAAAIASLFMADSWQRRTIVPLVPENQWPYAGQDIGCMIWLSGTTALKGSNFNVLNWFTQVSPQIKEKVPIYFLVGDTDKQRQGFYDNMSKALKKGGVKGVAALTGVKPVDGAKQLAGVDLLKPSLKTQDLISKYLETVMDKRGEQAPQKKEVDKQLFVPVQINRFLGGS